MPKRDIDYSKNVIYKICCNDLNISDIYIGHTSNLVQRRWKHKYRCNNNKDVNHHSNVYQFIRENGGWDNWSVIEIDKCPCLDFEEAAKIERYYIETFKSTLNIVIPLRTKKEWCEDNKEILVEKNKNYRKNNKEIIAEKAKVDYIKNKETKLERVKLYYEKNKDIINEKKKEKITCECGCIITKIGLIRHKKSQKHINLVSGV